MEWATYKQTKYLKKCIEALKHKRYMANEQAAAFIGVKLPITENDKDTAGLAIKRAHEELGGSVTAYWRRANAGKR